MKVMMKKSTAPTGRSSDKFMLRLPDGMRDTISELAKASGRSMNAELVHRIQRTIDEDAELSASGVKYIEDLNISRTARSLPLGTVLTSQEIRDPHYLSDELREVRELLASIRSVMTDELRESVKEELKKKNKNSDDQ